jgi:PEP-CTERM motif-containing protein
MSDKHYKVALILLTLPLSFGGGTSAGKTTGAADANNLLSLKESTAGHRGFQPTDVAGRFGASSSDFGDGLGRIPEMYVSSFGVAAIKRDASCVNLNSSCLSTGDTFSAGNSAMGFPMYDSFRNSETSQYSHSAGSAGPLGPGGGSFGGGGGGGGGSSAGPTSTPIATPEPGSFMLLAGGLILLAGLAGRRRQRNAA